MKGEVENADIIWLASYPRSGNTFLRTVLWHSFGLRSASVYPDDLGGNSALEEYVGHIEHGPELQARLQENSGLLVKTHEYAKDNKPAIYVIRDGRAACVSLWKFRNGKLPLEAVIEGQHMFGTWSSHVESWSPWTRPNTLLLEYEELRDNLPNVLRDISTFLNKKIINENIPDRNKIAESDGKWVREKTNWTSELTGANLRRFININKTVLKKAGYI